MSVFLILITSIIVLLWAANHLIRGASGLALHYRLPPLVTGLTLVAFGTSAPEIIISLTAALEGVNDIAVGNAIGTNIANIGLVLGLTGLLKPLRTSSNFLRREYPLLFLIMLFSYSLMIDGYLSILDGCLFLLGCIALISYFVFAARQQPQQHQARKYQQATLEKRSLKTHFFSFLLGLLLLPISAQFFIKSCLTMGYWLGINELILGLTVVAIGTCLPELITSLVATMKGASELAIGNILGANMLNLLAVMIFPSIIHPAIISHAVLWRDIPAMFLITLILFGIHYRQKKNMSRWHGGFLILVYCCYILAIIISALRF